MKGNEARIVLFLHPVKDVKEGHKVSQEKPTSMLPKFRSILLILGTVLALGVLAFVLTRFENNQQRHEEFSSTAVHPLESTKTDPFETEKNESEFSRTNITEPIATTMAAERTASTTRTTLTSTNHTIATATTTESTSSLTTIVITPTPGL